MSTRRRCTKHHLFPRCPGCEAEQHPDGLFPALTVPDGTVEWMRRAARFYASMGDEGAVAFVSWLAVDLHESA